MALHPDLFAIWTLAGIRLHGNDLLTFFGLSQANHLPPDVRTAVPLYSGYVPRGTAKGMELAPHQFHIQ